MARRLGDYLENKGFEVVRLTNADNFNYPETTVYFWKENLKAAYEIAGEIPGYQDIGNTRKQGKSDIKIKVLIGKDIVKYDNVFKKG